MKNRVTGILGGLICGFITTIPWILAYVYTDYIVSFLASLIAMGFVFGYRKLKGPIDKALPAIIIIASMFIIVITSTITIPLIILKMEDFEVSFQMLKEVYAFEEFRNAVLEDLAYSVIFTAIGIGGVIRKIKSEIGIEDKETLRVMNYKEEAETIKKKFEERGAISKETALPLDSLGIDSDRNKSFAQLKRLCKIRKYNGLYYYTEKSGAAYAFRVIRSIILSMFIVFALLIVLMVVIEMLME